MLIKEVKQWIHFRTGYFVGFYLLLSLVGLLGFSTLFCPDTFATVLTDSAFADSTIYARSPQGVWANHYSSQDIGGSIIDLDLSNEYGEFYNYVGDVYYYQPETTCSNSTTIYPVYTIFADHVRSYHYSGNGEGGDGLGTNYYNTSFYGNTVFDSNFVEEDSQTGEGFAYGVYLPQDNLPTSSNNVFQGQLHSNLAFSFYPYNATGSSSSDNVPIYLEILGVNSFCSRQEAEDFINNYIFQNTRPTPDDDGSIVSPDFPYSYDSDDADNNQELYNSIVSQNPASYEPQIGDAQSILNWFAQFIGQIGSIPDDPNDYRCNVMFYPNTNNIIGFDWNAGGSYSDMRFNACDNEFVYSINNSSSIIGSSDGVSSSEVSGSGRFFFISLKGILWLGCFLLIFKMLQNFYYYVYDIISYSFSLYGTIPEEGV